MASLSLHSKIKVMLHLSLARIKGQLLELMFEKYRDMNVIGDHINYQNFYEDFQTLIQSISRIKNLNDLEMFCEDYGLNDDPCNNQMSFPKIVENFYRN